MSDTDASGLAHAELLDLAVIMADWITGEWPGTLTETLRLSPLNAEQSAAAEKLEAYRDRKISEVTPGYGEAMAQYKRDRADQ